MQPGTSTSQHPPSHEGKRIIPNPNNTSPTGRKRRKTDHPAESNNATGPLGHQPPRDTQRPPALGQRVPTSPDRMRRTQAGGGGEASDRRDWAQPGSGMEPPAGRGQRPGTSSQGSNATSVPKPPLLSQRESGEKASQADDQNITSLSKDQDSERGVKRRLSVGQAEAEIDQKRLLNIVQDLDNLERQQKDYGKQQLRAIREGSV